MRPLSKLGFVAVIALAFVPSAPAKDGRPAAPRVEPQTVLVKFEQTAGASAKIDALGDKQAAKTANGVSVVRIQAGETVAAKVAQYDRRSDVDYAEPNYVASTDVLAPNDTYTGSLWGLASIGAVSGWTIYPGAYGGFSGVTVAIDDSGIDYTHIDLAGHVLTGLGATCLSGSCVANAAYDDYSHGTHVAGTIGAIANNALGVAGVAYNSPLLPVKVLDSTGSGSYASVASGILWSVNHGARVINLSLGGSGYSTTLCNAVSTAAASGVVVVAAAGNSGSNAPSYPAACPGAIGVAANDVDGSSAYFSNWGSPDVFISAPGVGIYSTYPGSTYASMSGTSMASPHVAGLAALLLGQVPTRSVADVKRVLAQTANKLGATLYPGLSYGADPYGSCSCTWHPFYGYGQIDVRAALAVATVPSITSIAPMTGAVGSSVTIAGTNFSGTTSVTLGGVAAAFTLDTPTQITATVPAGTAYDQQRWRVTNADGTGTYEPLFTITHGPTLTAVAPMSGLVGSLVVITGVGFAGATSVTLGGVAAAFTLDSPTQITATVPAGTLYDQQRWRVTTPAGTGAYDPLFTIIRTLPIISSISPMSGLVGSSVTMTGTNFGSATSVTLGGVPAVFTVDSPTQITATVPAGTPYDQQRWRVTNAGGTGVYDPLFTILHVPAATPMISGLSTMSGLVGSTVTITGMNFTGATSVTLGGVAAAFTVDSATQITATVPGGTPYDQQRWRVTNPQGTATYDPLFTIIHAGTAITSVAPMSGAIGSAVTITGTNLSGVTAVTLGGVTASFSLDSATQITAMVPAGTAYDQQRWRVVDGSGTYAYDPLFTITNWTAAATVAARALFNHRA